MGFAIYGPPILQQLRGFSPLWAGYVVAVESLAWTVAAIAVAAATGAWDRRWTRLGAVMLVASLVVGLGTRQGRRGTHAGRSAPYRRAARTSGDAMTVLCASNS